MSFERTKILFRRIAEFSRTHRRELWILLCVIGLLFALVISEFRTSRLQAKYFSRVGKELTYKLKPGLSRRIRFPSEGPFDIRLGYTRIPGIVRNLTREGFYVEAQAEISDRLASLIDGGLFPIYHEKAQAGLKILDKNEDVLYQVTRPERVYQQFADIPSIVSQTILFIENREILDKTHPYRNPAVEWDRFALAIFEKAQQLVHPSHSAPGGSTIATQLEKYLHGFEGRTRGVRDKLQQMLSASYRSYLDGENTYETRKRIVMQYINSIPLAALAGYGEVSGLGDGLWAWYGVELSEIEALFKDYSIEYARERAKELAPYYKRILSLFVAHRRPSFYLLSDPKYLNDLTNDYLHLVAAEGLIPIELRDEALKVDLKLRTSAPPPAVVSFVERKAANAIRTTLLRVLRFRHLYDMDQVDLTVKSSLDKTINNKVSDILISLKDRKNVEKFGLLGARTLAKGDPAKVIYSVALYERVNNVNLLRVQTDNLDRPFDINEGTRLDLGSTAKLRVLANYLGVVGDLHEELSALDKSELKEVAKERTDPLSRWMAERILKNPKTSLEDTLDAAMARTYSASPAETFFTGGGIHTFVNFNKDDNGRVVTVQEALRHSINLPFIRLIRDVLRYYMSQLSGGDSPSPGRRESKREQYLKKFADKEGSYFLQRFYQKYKNKSPSEIVGGFVKSIRPTQKRLAVIFRHIKPAGSADELKMFLEDHLSQQKFSDSSVKSLYESFGPDKYSLNDQGYLARVHPLELWLVGYLVNHPGANFSEVLEESKQERQEVYQWLMKKHNKRAQDVRIRSIIEAEGFLEMHEAWKDLGFPFRNMVPSYATAIGNSGDRPAALAELMGIIVNDGMRYPMQRMERLHFAKGTPFETILSVNRVPEGERVMRPEVARILKKALRDVVENGTARRINKAFKTSEGEFLPIGGKTGTGDNRYETFGKGGQLLTSRVVNRTATFVFYIGDRFFGTVTAHVQGEDAAHYDFTSALAAELLKVISPALAPLVESHAQT